MRIYPEVIAVIIALMAGGSFIGITHAFEQPEHGKKEYIDKHYGDLLRSLDAVAVSASSLFSFGAAIEELNLPEEVLYVGIIKDKEKTDIIKRFNWNSRSVLAINNYGFGKLGSGGVKKEIMIYENDGPWDYMDKFVVYIEYKGSAEVTPP
jgi:hypothetical protein